jgi:hypothetical protein
MLLLALLAMLLRWELNAAAGEDAGSCLNKLVWPSDLALKVCCREIVMEVEVRLLFFSHQGGGEGGCWSAALHRLSWQGAADFCGVHQLQPWFAVVIHGHRGRSVLQCSSHCSFINLLAAVPLWRPFRFFVTALNASSTSSGFVPDDGAGGRDVEIFLGREGPNCVSQFLFRVLVVKVEGLFVIPLFPVVLYVKCKPTV